jgi:hypothetical protein
MSYTVIFTPESEAQLTERTATSLPSHLRKWRPNIPIPL